MKPENVNEATYTGKPVVARKKGQLGAVLIDPKTGKPIAGSWKSEKDVPGGIPSANKSTFFKKERQSGAYIRPEIKNYKPETKAQIDARVATLNKGPSTPSSTPATTPASAPPSGGSATTSPASRPSAARTAPKPPDSPEVSKYMSAAAAARKSGSSAEMAKARDMGMDIWKKSNPKLASASAERERTRGTSATTNPLMQDMKSKLPAPKAAVLKQSYEHDAFDLVLEYLFSQGHVGTLDEALYVMMGMDSEMIQNIVESTVKLPGESGSTPSSGYKEPVLPGEQRKVKYQQQPAPNTSKLPPA